MNKIYHRNATPSPKNTQRRKAEKIRKEKPERQGKNFGGMGTGSPISG
jgi:hypothetical protein